MSTSSKSGGVIKRIGEDSRLRPFLSNHFNPQDFIKAVIREGRSEDIFKEITTCIEDVNEEIKIYITQHKDNLMSGMQDVATLAERYATLASTSQKLHRNIERLKKEALQSYDLVKLRTCELERIHSASTSLRYLRQFSNAKAQLDHALKSATKDSMKSNDASSAHESPLTASIITSGGAGMDIRQLATAAKTVSELESLLDLPALSEIKFVTEHAASIREFGQQLRRRSQERLLSSLKERDQASVASSLQVFFNLQSLPEIVVLAIDATVRHTVEISRQAIDLDSIVATHSELASAHTGTRAAAVAAVLGGGNTKASSGTSSTSQVRVALREMAHHWATLVHEQAMQIHVLQRVVSKKEDPATHKRFMDVLKIRVGNGQHNQNLANGRLLELFWERLIDSLQEIATEKIKGQPLAANRIYPFLRKAAVEIVDNLRVLSIRDLQRDSQGLVGASSVGAGSSSALDSTGGGTWALDGGMFGSLALPQDELLGLLGVSAKKRISRARNDRISGNSRGNHRANSNNSETNSNDLSEQGLVKGLGPMRDRYLVGCFNRMVHPIMQMFPEMEGYTAAVPSKRDLQALTKAMQTELVNVAVDSEVGLLRSVNREALKAVQLMITKIEGMIMNNAETIKIVSAGGANQGSFTKTTSQEHNSQLVVLLGDLKASLEKMPLVVLKSAQEAPGSFLAVSLMIGGEDLQSDVMNTDSVVNAVLGELHVLSKSAIVAIEELTARQLLSPMVEVLTAHVKSLLFSLPKEGVVSAPSSSNKSAEFECSRAVQGIVKQVPELIKVYLGSLPKSPLVVAATEELCIRIMHSYISTASLLRPVTDASRMRTAKDMSVLEVMVNSLAPGVNVKESCPVVQEFK